MGKPRSDPQIKDLTTNLQLYMTEIDSYFNNLLEIINHQPASIENTLSAEETANTIFNILTSRKFCYLSTQKVLPYYSKFIDTILPQILKQQPIQFYLDIGGGYHASLDVNKGNFNFIPTLGEFFILTQIKQFGDRIKQIYSPGVKFFLVIDNLSAFLINEIAIENTTHFANNLKELIVSLGLSANINIMLESDLFKITDYSHKAIEHAENQVQLTQAEINNISRFLGHLCNPEEAQKQAQKYATICEIAESLLDTIINGVHLTQRATGSTLGFRAFPGSDSRIQCGEVVMSLANTKKLKPFLLTNKTLPSYNLATIELSHIIPSSNFTALFAEQKPTK